MSCSRTERDVSSVAAGCQHIRPLLRHLLSCSGRSSTFEGDGRAELLLHCGRAELLLHCRSSFSFIVARLWDGFHAERTGRMSSVNCVEFGEAGDVT